MKCSQCHSAKIKTKESRKTEIADLHTVHRVRHCIDCKHVWHTYEITEELMSRYERNHEIFSAEKSGEYERLMEMRKLAGELKQLLKQ